MTQWTELALWDRKYNGVLRRGSFILKLTTTVWAGASFRAPTLPASGWGWSEGGEIATAPASWALTKRGGNLLFQQITALDNRTETHGLISARPTCHSLSLTKRSRNGRRHEATWSGLPAHEAGHSSWVNTCPELGWVCLLAFPKEHWLWKGFKTSPYQGDTTELCHWAGTTLLPICMKGKKEEGMSRPCGES